MKEQIPGLLFFLKKPKHTAKNQNQKQPQTPYYVYQRVTVNGIPKEWSLKKKWHPNRWNQQLGRANDAKEDAKMLNQYLDSLTAKFSRAERALVDNDKEITSEAIKELVAGPPPTPRMLVEEIKTHVAKIHAKIGLVDGYALATYKRFKTTLAHTQNFISYKYGQADINIKNLDYCFVADFYDYLRTVKRCSNNSTVKYLSGVKKIVVECVKRGYIHADPFMRFPLTTKQIPRLSLTIEELKRLMEKQFSTFRLTFVRDLFVFSCFTGLCFIDITKLRRADIVTMAGAKWIIVNRTKTKVEAKIPLLPQALEILERYTNPNALLSTEPLIIMKSNQKFNEYLKEIAELCEICKTITFHMARHTFATTVTLRYGIPIHIVALMLGHKKLSQTQHYAITNELQVAEEMKVLSQKINFALDQVSLED
jgi:site-specific recombinase XerD